MFREKRKNQIGYNKSVYVSNSIWHSQRREKGGKRNLEMSTFFQFGQRRN